VYVFLQGIESWEEQSRLLASDGQAGDAFGASAALSGAAAAIGAPDDDNERGAGAGSVYLFTRSGAVWAEQTRLVAGNGEAEDGLGTSVDIENTTLAAGAPRGGMASGGAVYVFEQAGPAWPQEALLEPLDAVAGDAFGGALSLDDSYLLASASGQNGSSGAAYVFRRTSDVWAEREESKIEASEGAEGNLFGASVALSGDFALIGSEGVEGGRGVAHLFQRDGLIWLEQARLSPTDEEGADRFGSAVALEGEHAVVGAWNDANGNGATAGAAYFISVTGSVSVVATEEKVAAFPYLELDQNYPNPARMQTTIAYTLGGAGPVRLGLYDVLGRRIATLVDEVQGPGRRQVVVDLSRLAGGIYLYRLEAGRQASTRRLTVIP
jgi:hypothetical protein